MFNAAYNGSFISSSTDGNHAISNQGGYLQFKYASGNAPGTGITWNNALEVAPNGNVGIGGLIGASEKLEVAGNVKFSGSLMPGGSAGTAGQILQSTGPGTAPVWAAPSGSLSGGTTNYVTKWQCCD